MSDEFDRAQANRQPESAIHRQPAQFQEAPGETEAEATRDSFLKAAGHAPASQAAALSAADGTTRARAVSRLQQERGNAYVQRLVNEARGAPGRLVGRSQPEMVNEVQGRKGSGQPLPDNARSEMENHFGAPLDNVRVHTDGEARSLNKELNAQAFTVGSDVFFADGKYNPSSSEGKGLIAHELTHVGQQTGFGGQSVQREAVQRAEEEETKPAAGEAPMAEAKKPEEAPAEGGAQPAGGEAKKEEQEA